MSITEPQPAAPKPGRPWFQYSLRTLLLVVTLGAVLCSWLAVKMKEAEEQRIARLQSLVAAARIAQRDWEQAQEADSRRRVRLVLCTLKVHSTSLTLLRKGTTKAEPARAMQLRAKGLTVAEIATTLGTNKRTVQRYLKGSPATTTLLQN